MKLLAIILGLALALRLALALTYPHYWGIDGGASLLTVNAVLGNEPTHAGFPKPPFAPGWLLAPFVLTLGADIGYKVWSSIFAITPLVPVYLLTRHYLQQRAALAATTFAAIDLTWGEMFVTGAHPLPAFALLGIAWWCLAKLAKLSQQQSWAPRVLLVFSIGLIPWINQTAAGLAIITLPVAWVGFYFFAQRRSQFFWDTAPSVILGGILGVMALPWYMQTLPGSPILAFDGPKLYWAWTWATFQAFVIALPTGIFILWRAPRHLKPLGLVLITLGFMVNWLSFDEVIINPLYRARYLMAVAFYPCMAWIVFTRWLPYLTARRIGGIPGRRVAAACAVAAFLYFGALFVYVIHLQLGYSLMVSQDTARTLAWLKERDPESGVATNSFTLSLWVAALNRARSPFAFTAPPPPQYVQADQDLRCLYNWVQGCDPSAAAQRLDVDYLLVEERFPKITAYSPENYKAPPRQWERTAQAPWLDLAYESGTVKLWRVANTGTRYTSNGAASTPAKPR